MMSGMGPDQQMNQAEEISTEEFYAAFNAGTEAPEVVVRERPRVRMRSDQNATAHAGTSVADVLAAIEAATKAAAPGTSPWAYATASTGTMTPVLRDERPAVTRGAVPTSVGAC